MPKKKSNEQHLRVYKNKSEFHRTTKNIEVFQEGTLTKSAISRVKKIKDELADGFLEEMIINLKTGEDKFNRDKISDNAFDAIDGLVESLTSEVGRALIGLSIMQMSIKSIDRQQNIRLHKGGSSANSFSWSEGISMRTLDKSYVTPTLRKYDLLRLNADGFMMTRSLAENYPYTSLYKAHLRGARQEWLTLVDEVESESTDASESLKLLLAKLINAAAGFEESANALIKTSVKKTEKITTRLDALSFVERHIDLSDYAARLLEISMHALLQAVVESGALGHQALKPLSQMRSANKKHGNIGDIELLENDEIIESWDAKYGKGYLREEIEEVAEKLAKHEAAVIVGFVTTSEIERIEEIEGRISEIEDLYSISLRVVTLSEWVELIYKRAIESELISEKQLSGSWIQIYSEYLCQKRREQAPIDEPCLQWIDSLKEVFTPL